MKKVIIIDMDDTSVDTTSAWIKRMNEKTGILLNPEDWKEWNLRKVYEPKIADPLLDILNEKGFFRNLQPKNGAVESITLLHELGFDLVFLTMVHNTQQMVEKSEWIDEHFGHLDRLTYMPTSHNMRKDVVIGDYFVEDAPEFILSSPIQHKIVMDRPCNRFIQGLPRAYSWDDVLLEILLTHYKQCPDEAGNDIGECLGWIRLTEKELVEARDRFEFQPQKWLKAEKNLMHILNQHRQRFLQTVKGITKGVAV